LRERDFEGATDKIDTALERLLNYLSKKHGAKPESEIEDQSGKKFQFPKWGVTQYIAYLDREEMISKAEKAAFFQVHNLRNKIKHQDAATVAAHPKLLERAISVVEYAVCAQTLDETKVAPTMVSEGGAFVLPTTRVKVIPRAKLRLWASTGWYEAKSYGSNIEIRRERYGKWETFEIKVRFMMLKLGFENCIEDIENFSYKALGPQIDACGGSAGTFFVIDCTSKKKLGHKEIQYKIDDILKKEKGIKQEIDKLYPGKYPIKVFVICSEDIEISETDKQSARNAGIRLIDNDEVNYWFRYYSTLGIGLRNHIIKSLSGFSPVIVDNEKDPFFHYRAFKVQQDGQVVYHLLADPKNLLNLAYVYRLELGDPEGYQRALIRKKILNINGFLATLNNYFANNLVLCFDSLVNNEYWPDFEPLSVDGSSQTFGILHVPKVACSAEVIDGQHRLYGYLDATEEQSYSTTLTKRRSSDRLSVVAITDPTNNQRATLFVDINSNQTKVNPRQVWALVGKVRANTLMGYTANIIIGLNDRPVFRNKIHIPGINKSSNKDMNIANLGKGLQDRKLLNKEEGWNLFGGDRRTVDYSVGDISAPIKQIESFFRPFLTDKNASKFVFTNNGANVILRVLAEKLRFEYMRKKPLTAAETKQLTKTVKNYLAGKELKDLLRRSSNEAVRGELAKEIMTVIQTTKGMSHFAEDQFD